MFKKKKKSISDITEFQGLEETNGYPIIKCKSGYTYFFNIKGHDLASLKEEEYIAYKEGIQTSRDTHRSRRHTQNRRAVALVVWANGHAAA